MQKTTKINPFKMLMNIKHKWNITVRDAMFWIVVNLGTVTILLSGVHYNIPFLILVAEISFIFISIMGIIIGVYSYAVYHYVDLINSNDTPDKNKIFGIDLELFEDIPEVPKGIYILDMIYDFAIAALLIFWGFAWIPLLYILHIIGIAYYRWNASEIVKAHSDE